MRQQLTQRPFHFMDTVFGTDVTTSAVYQLPSASVPNGASGAIVANTGSTTIWYTGGNTVVAGPSGIGIVLGPGQDFTLRDNVANLTRLRFAILNNVANGRLTWQFILE